MKRRDVWLRGTAGGVFVLSLTALVWAGLTGGFELHAGSVRILSVHDPERPFFLALVALGILAGTCRRGAAVRRSVQWLNSGFLVLLLLALWLGLQGPPELNGDGLEYVVQTQTIALRGELRIDTDAARAYWNRTNPYGVVLGHPRPPADRLDERLQAGGGFGGLYPDRHGNYRYYHYWMYSASVAPLYALLHWMAPNSGLEYAAFRLMNLVYLCVPFVLAWRLRASWPLLIVCGVAFFSPLIPYVDWQHTELFAFGLVVSAFFVTRWKHARPAGPLLLGVAAAQTVPLVLFFPLHLLDAWSLRRPQGCRGWCLFLLPYAAGSAVALSSLLYFQLWFGVPNVISAIGLASFEYASWLRLRDLFVHPMIGAVWFFPVCFFAVPSAWRRSNAWFAATALVTMAAAGWLACATDNLNAGQIGASRHMVWLLTPLWFMALNGRWQLCRFTRNARTACFSVGILLALVVVNTFGTHRLPAKKTADFTACRHVGRAVVALYRWLPYRGDPEMVVEAVVGHEQAFRLGAFNGIYIWNLDEDLSLWVLSERAARRMRGFLWKIPEPPSADVWPPQPGLFESAPGGVAFRPPDRVQFRHHPVLGGYVRARVHRRVERQAIATDAPVYMRDAEREASIR